MKEAGGGSSAATVYSRVKASAIFEQKNKTKKLGTMELELELELWPPTIMHFLFLFLTTWSQLPLQIRGVPLCPKSIMTMKVKFTRCPDTKHAFPP